MQNGIIDRVQSLDRRALFFITLVLAVISFLPYQFWKQPSILDRANWDYFAQEIVRGAVPYRDVVNIKAPLSAYIGAAAIVITKSFGLRDIFAIRIVYLFLASLTVGFTFLVTHAFSNSRRVALLAALIMMAFNLFGDANAGGVQPKTPMILFGLIALWAIQKDKPFAAGFAAMLSALSWQPGLLFAGVVFLGFSRYLTSWRDGKALKAMAGALLPLGIFIGYFWFERSLADIYWWLIDYNLMVDAPRGLRTIPQLVDRFYRLMKGAFRPEWPYFLVSIVGLVIVGWRASRITKRDGFKLLVDNAPRHAVIIAPLIYFAFCLINIQGGVDMIPLLPFVAMFAAVGIVCLIDRVVDLLSRAKLSVSRYTLNASIFAAVAALVMIFSVADVLLLRVESPTLKDQDAEVAEITSHLAPGDQIYVHGLAEILVLSGLSNADKHFFLDRGKDNYLDRVEPGGFSGWLDRLKAKRPKVVALERMKFVERKEDFYDWVHADYEEHKDRVFTYYLRRDAN
ncbi:MAG TPA: DolP-mannose mannosyltransferase [Blastocatellia bacterium]|nr:DolP-mannose mannosyltransferase [Blastocatellia bacterium]